MLFFEQQSKLRVLWTYSRDSTCPELHCILEDDPMVDPSIWYIFYQKVTNGCAFSNNNKNLSISKKN